MADRYGTFQCNLPSTFSRLKRELRDGGSTFLSKRRYLTTPQHDVTFRNTAIFTLTTAKTSNLMSEKSHTFGTSTEKAYVEALRCLGPAMNICTVSRSLGVQLRLI